MQKRAQYSNNAFFDESKVIIITGASSGIGKAVSLALVKYKPKLVLVARRKKKLLHTASLLKKHKIKTLSIVGDVRNRNDRMKIIDLALKTFGRIDVLINNAGVGKANLFLEQPEEEIDQLIETNILSLIKMTHAVVPIMITKYCNFFNFKSVRNFLSHHVYLSIIALSNSIKETINAIAISKF